MTALRDLAMRSLVTGVPEYLAQFDEASGRFITPPTGPVAPGAQPEDLGWAVTNQDGIYALAFLYRTQHPDNPYYGDQDVLDKVLRGGDAIRAFQDEDGRVEFIKTDGSKWGPTYMPWTMYHWLETYALLRDQLGAEREASWRKGLMVAYEGIVGSIAALQIHNIPTWNGMASYRAGQVFRRSDWMAAGSRMCQTAAEAQQPGGWWSEHGGPTTLYNLVYLHALGLYHLFSRDVSVLPAIERAIAFHSIFTYPDGAAVETVDGRVKYHGQVNTLGLPAFSLTAAGRGLLRLLFQPRETVRDLTRSCTAHMASLAHYGLEGPEEPCPLAEASFVRTHDGVARVQRQGPWFACLSAFVGPPVADRWGQDRQQFVSLWHERAGLVVGGGNSRQQPEWSSFVVRAQDRVIYVPGTGRLDDGAVLGYDEATFGLGVELLPDCATIRARCLALPASGTAEHRLLLVIKAGRALNTSLGRHVVRPEESLKLDFGQAGGFVEHNGWRLELPAGARLQWPVFPFNPYAIDGAAPVEEARGVVTVPLAQGQCIRWKFRWVG